MDDSSSTELSLEGYLQHSSGINWYQLERWFDAAWTPVGGRLSVNPDYKKFRASICELEYSHVQIFGKPKLGTGGSGDRNRTSNTVRAHLLPRFKVQTIISRLRAFKHDFRFVANLRVQSRLFPLIRALSAMRTAPGVTSAEIIMRNSLHTHAARNPFAIRMLGSLRDAPFRKNIGYCALSSPPAPLGAFGPRASSHLPTADKKGLLSPRSRRARRLALPPSHFACAPSPASSGEPRP